MDDGSDLAIISGSGKLPSLIKNTYKNATNFSFTDPEKETENKVVKCEFERLGFLLVLQRLEIIIPLYIVPKHLS